MWLEWVDGSNGEVVWFLAVDVRVEFDVCRLWIGLGLLHRSVDLLANLLIHLLHAPSQAEIIDKLFISQHYKMIRHR